jgi:hypothetical protein
VTVAYTRSSNLLTTYSGTSNNNAFYCGTPGTTRLIYSDGSNAISSMTSYQSLVSPRDGASIAVNAPFINSTTSPFNLHLQSGIATPFESGGIPVSSPVITSDFDSDSRQPNPGYPDNIGQPASSPDIGADEFAGGLPARALSLSVFLEGLYDVTTHMMRQAYAVSAPQYGPGIADQITVELRNSSTGAIEYSSNVYLQTNGNSSVVIPTVHDGSYYIYIRHRNSVAISTVTPVSFNGLTISYAFDGPAKAFGSNLLRMIDGYYVVYGGDANQDGFVDAGDMVPVDNLSSGFAKGYLPEDLNGDGLINSADITIIENHAGGFVNKALPF